MTFDLGPNHRVRITRGGRHWRLKRRSTKKGQKKKWETVGSGTVEDDDSGLVNIVHRSLPDTPLEALRTSLALQRATELYQLTEVPRIEAVPPPELSGE